MTFCKSNVELIHIGERSTASRTRVLQDARRPLAEEKRAGSILPHGRKPP